MSSASVDTTVTVSLKRRDASLRVLYLHVLTTWTLDVVVSAVFAKLNAYATLGFFVRFFALTDVISHDLNLIVREEGLEPPITNLEGLGIIQLCYSRIRLENSCMFFSMAVRTK